MSNSTNHIIEELDRFKRKYFLRLFLKGAVLFLSLIITLYLFISALEYIGHFDSTTRLVLLISFSLVSITILIRYLLIPLKRFINNKNELSHEIAASEVGRLLPNISDRLLNTIQLLGIEGQDQELLLASIEQRSTSFESINFSQSITYDEFKKRYLLLLLIPLSALTFSIYTFPEFASIPAQRIINYKEEFVPQAPFEFILNSDLKTYISESYKIDIRINGDAVPTECSAYINGVKRTLNSDKTGEFYFRIEEVLSDIELIFEASGYQSKRYHIQAIHRPEFLGFSATINYPSYIKLPSTTINSIGSISIPEGSFIHWDISTEYATQVSLYTEPTLENITFTPENGNITFRRQFLGSEVHTISAYNEKIESKERFHYHVNVVEDQYPKISIKPYQDSLLYTYLFINGNIVDDYGFSQLKFFFRKKTRLQTTAKYQSIPVTFSRSTNVQAFNFEVNLDSLQIGEEETIEYYVSVWDNDQINNPKETRSRNYSFEIPSKQTIENEIDNSSAKSTEELDEALKEAKDLKKKVDDLSKNIKTKKELTWQDKKEVENIINKHQQLENKIHDLQQNIEETQQKEERFNEFDENIKEKAQQLQNLMKEIMDEDTRRMMKELSEMMKDNLNKEDLDKILEEMNKKDENMENELDRTLEMYKNLKYEKDFQKAANQMEKLAEAQKELSELGKDNNMDSDVLKKEQEHLNKKFDELQQELEQLKKDGQELGRKEDLDAIKKEAEQIQQEMQDSQESLSKGKNKKASESQEKASDDMQKLAQKMQEMQQTEQMQAAQENLDDLRDILENLLTLSFSQEKLITDFKGIRLTDPRFVELSQEQLKLLDDSRMIEDSLLSLAKRVIQIQSFVTREVTQMKNHMNDATEKLKDRKPREARSHQQYAMTSINNLALLLSDVMEQMQQQMAQQMPGEQQCNKPGQNKKPGLGQMQQQLNQMMQQLKNGQKQGRSLSKQLAQMAAQQQRIRQAMKEMEGQSDKQGNSLGDQLKKISKLMEETEKDLLYKKYDSKTYERNEEILTRLLEAETAAQQRGLDNKREAQQSTPKHRTNPPQLDEYLKEKEKQIELLKTIPPSLNPYFKKEVDEYFNTIEN